MHTHDVHIHLPRQLSRAEALCERLFEKVRCVANPRHLSKALAHDIERLLRLRVVVLIRVQSARELQVPLPQLRLGQPLALREAGATVWVQSVREHMRDEVVEINA